MADRRSSPPRAPSRCALIGCGVEVAAAEDCVGAEAQDLRQGWARRTRRRLVRPSRRLPILISSQTALGAESGVNSLIFKEMFISSQTALHGGPEIEPASGAFLTRAHRMRR
ncbi:MAG: hypothetical protein M2R45_05454 [Verrucomicrobia subdivision 3 bacterium]|nr:hypothetical protein [Limisphaerales bacterium]